MRVLVTPRSLTGSPHPLVERLRGHGLDIVYGPKGTMPSEADLLSLVPGCAGWLAGVEPVSESVIAAAKDLRIIARNGTGIDNLPLDALKARGIALTRADGANARGVAELAIGLILGLLRHLPATDSGIKAGGWPRIVGREIAGRRVGVVGCGAVGAQVAQLCAALGARVVGYDPLRPAVSLAGFSLQYADRESVLAESDIVSLHCPPLSSGPLIDGPMLARMRHGVLIVNTARAELVDEAAMISALETGRVGGYGVDVFAPEPPATLDLVAHSNVIATSHIGGLTEESIHNATQMATDSLIAALVRPSPMAGPQ